MKHKLFLFVSLAISLLTVQAATAGSQQSSPLITTSYTSVSEEGSLAVSHPSYNRYKGFGLSIEKYDLKYDNGTRLRANFRNLTLNNRNLSLSLTRAGLFGLTLHNNQYRRVYNNPGDQFTRRRNTSGQLWFQPSDMIRLFGGYGVTGKKGTMVNLFDAAAANTATAIEYSHAQFNAGIRLNHEKKYIRFEYRGSSYTDETSDLNDRTSTRLRVNAFAPLPFLPYLQNVFVNGGFQSFESRVTDRFDTLTANTVWGGLQASYGPGFSLKYNFIWDRSRGTGDLSATDNIAHSILVGKGWTQKGGITVGYRFGSTDGVLDEISKTGYLASGWIKPINQLTIRASFGSQDDEVQEGQTLTGDRSYNRYRGSIRYKLPRGLGTVRVYAESKKREYDDIGASAEFLKAGSDGRLVWSGYGELEASYSYIKGEYTNAQGLTIFNDHAITGDLTSREFNRTTVGIGGTYVRSRQGVDVESTQIRLVGKYAFLKNHLLTVKYTVDNFDNYVDASPVYTEYYTANVVEVSLSHQF